YSFVFLSFTLKGIEMSIAYAIWSEMGIVTITIVDFFYLGENINLIKGLAIFY
ncbi:TPA: QacE family quaternary ammonium compound efflux SMR transporter, partial [Bacillus cytotoxicus]|nr:QacE family quaternary ammonium compound efflux SMR transporter [Bacillus cytotoxicus]